MEKSKEQPDKSHPSTYSVLYRQIGILCLGFVLGIASLVLIQNFYSKEALRSESSTDVIGKRLEDIISGKVGAISHQVADVALQERGIKDRASFENEIREALLQQISPQKQLEAQTESEKLRQGYREFQKEVLDAFSSIPGVQISKIGDGRFDGTGDDLFDGIFLLKNQRIGVSVFSSHYMQNPISFEYVFRISSEVINNRISDAYFVIDAPSEQQSQLAQRVFPYNEVLSDKISEHIDVIAGTKDVIKKLVKNTFISSGTQGNSK